MLDFGQIWPKIVKNLILRSTVVVLRRVQRRIFKKLRPRKYAKNLGFPLKIRKSLRKAKEIEVSIVVLICYMTAERLGSVLLLQTKAINITMKRCFVQFHRFKTMGTAHGQIPLLMKNGRMATMIQEWMHVRRNHKSLFQVSYSKVFKTINLYAPKGLHLSGHSFRRGVLQELVRLGIKGEVIRQLSGHKTAYALFQYLREIPHDEHDRITELQANLEMAFEQA